MIQSDKNAPLRADIRFLGEQLGWVLNTQVSPEFYKLEEALREQCKKARKTPTEALIENIRNTIREQPTLTLMNLTKAFGIYFQLVNLAEQHHRIRRKEAYESEGHTVKYSLEYLLALLKSAPAKETQSLLNQIKVTPVMTAHPTHIMRQTILRKHRRLRSLMNQPRELLSERQSAQHLRKTRQEISNLWQSHLFHQRTITVMDEVKNLFTYFDASLFEVVPQVHQELEEELGFPVPNMLKVGSWVGGDRDGHPFVTAQTTLNTLSKQKEYALNKYIEKLSLLQDHLSMSRVYQDVSPAFLQRSISFREAFSHLNAELCHEFPDELYRQFIGFIKHKLQLSKAQIAHPGAYKDSQGLLQDLKELETSLKTHKSEIALYDLKQLIRQVQIFKFHLATLDIRQDSEVHSLSVSELFKVSGISNNYVELSENEKVSLLLEELVNPRPIYNPLFDYSPQTKEVIQTFRTIKHCLDTIDPECITTYIMSMCQSPSDILNVLLLAKENGLAQLAGDTPQCQLQIVPLFETLEDLQTAPDTMKTLFQIPLYKKCLNAYKNTQEIMLGYSDSSKRAGIMAATWQLYETQQNLTNMAKEADIQLRFFHGRGGSISRGGGPTHHAIMAQPSETLWGEIRLTEQGEVLSWKYNFPELAHRELSVLLSSVIEVSLEKKVNSIDSFPQWKTLLKNLSIESHKYYCGLVDHPDFLTFFQQSTPLKPISELNIGSRPAKRKNTQSIHDLRAIPWVFSWMQSRCLLPAWYGVGHAIECLAKNKENVLLDLQKMYKEWRFFQVFIDNLQMTLSKADMQIADCYMDLVESPELKNHFKACIHDEYKRATQWVLKISQQTQLLDNKTTLQKSINLRNPYVDPLSYIQVELLDRLKKTPEDAELTQALKLSIMGVSEGLRNTG